MRERKPLQAREFGEPGVRAGFCARCCGVRTRDPGTRAPRVSRGRTAASTEVNDALRVASGNPPATIVRNIDQPALSDVARGTPDRLAAHSPAIRRRQLAGSDQPSFSAWCVELLIELLHIQPSKLDAEARVESFHGRLRDECLTVSWFQNLFDARRKIAAWKIVSTKSGRIAVWVIKPR